MPRQGVPYPSREICSLKCQIDALNAKINELMKSINGVQGDGQGDLTLVSGDPAIVINNDQAQHEIEIALDGSQLPAAAVSSVNGQTGAVVLEADDIASDGNSDVQADIDALKALGVNLQGAIGNEVTARGNADAALQGNINTVSAGIPAAAAAAVAADPTVAQLAVDVPNKLDKITSGSSLKAYTHNGSTQGEKSVVDGVDADSIAIRDANGRLRAADPASGATDKTLVTANWVSQTGDSGPNNLMHRTGNETFSGTKTATDLQHMNSRPYLFQRVISTGKWFKVFRLSGIGRRVLQLDVIWAHQSYNGYGIGRAVMAAIGGSTTAKWLYKSGNASAFTADTIFIGIDSTGIDIWIKGGYFVYAEISRAIRGNVEDAISNITNVYDDTGYDSIDTSQYTNYAYGSE